MYKYVIRRLLLSIPVLLLSSLIVFGLMRVMPGDALTVLMGESGNVSAKDLQKLQKELGLDRPYVEQYGIWLWQMVSLNPGYSIFTNEPITVALKKAVRSQPSAASRTGRGSAVTGRRKNISRSRAAGRRKSQ